VENIGPYSSGTKMNQSDYFASSCKCFKSST